MKKYVKIIYLVGLIVFAGTLSLQAAELEDLSE